MVSQGVPWPKLLPDPKCTIIRDQMYPSSNQSWAREACPGFNLDEFRFIRFIITLSSYELYSFHIFSMNLLNQKMFNLQYSPTPYRILRNHSEWFIRNDSFLPVWICNIVCLRFLLKSSSESELSALSDFEVTETICPSSRSISKSCVRVCFSKSWSHWCSYNVHGFLNHDIFSDTHALCLSNLILKSQCVGGAKDVMV